MSGGAPRSAAGAGEAPVTAGQRTADASTAAGVAFGVAAYLWWGLVPIYFKAVDHVPALEVLAHRIAWCVVLLAIWLVVTRQLATLRPATGRGRVLALLGASTALIAVNWFLFIWAVSTGQVLQASLGYFINPLVNVLLGLVFLGERLDRVQWASVALAAAGVVVVTAGQGTPPGIALALAFSFGLYGLLRKRAAIDAAAGLALETAFLLPLAVGFLLWADARGALVFGHLSPTTDLLLVAAGPVTALPLLWFISAARRLRLVTMGFLQYLAPSLHFLLAVLVYREPFGGVQMVAFLLIWTALALFSLNAAQQYRRGRRARRAAAH